MNNHSYKKSLPVFLSVLVFLPLLMPLWSGQLIQGHDSLDALVRAICMKQYMGDGQFLVRWAADLNQGYGSPMFNFYPPFFSFLNVLLSYIVPNMTMAINLSLMVLWVAAGLGMYLFAKEFWGRKGGFLSALAYVYAPYYVQDIYVRGAFAEFASFTFFPWLLFLFSRISIDPRKRYVAAALVCVFLMSLTHFMCVLFLAVAAGYIVLLYFFKRDLRFLLIAFFILALGMMMSAFFWLPASYDSRFLNISFITSMRYDFHKNFVLLDQLLRVPWDFSRDMENISFRIGWVHLIFASVISVQIFKMFRKELIIPAVYYLFFVIAVLATFLTSPYSAAIWKNFHALKFLQFPWRFLSFVVFAVCFLAGSWMVIFKDSRWNHWVFIVSMLLLIGTSSHFIFSKRFIHIDEQSIKSHLSDRMYLGEGERTPKWIQIPPSSVPQEKIKIIQGAGQISQYVRINALEHQAFVKTLEPSWMCLHSFYFPGWKVFIDGQETQVYPENPYGLIVFAVPSGEHEIRIAFELTAMRSRAVAISWAGLFLSVAFLFVYRRFTGLGRL